MSIDSVVSAQRDLLWKLQSLTDRPILVQRHLKNPWHEWVNDYPNNPFQTRSILSNELSLDMDTRNWDIQKIEGEKLLTFLKQDQVPYYMAFSGGKSMHYHIFIDASTIAFPDELYTRLKEHPEIDIPCLIREYLTNYIIVKAGINSDIAELDWSNISWSKDGQGSMIRIEGCERLYRLEEKWYKTYKTVVFEIPDQKPTPEDFSLPLKFPEKIELWEISHLQSNIIKLLESKMEQCERNLALMQIARLKRLTSPHISIRKKCHGFQRAEAGVQEGIRDFVCTGLICACKKWLKMSQDECRSFMHEWNARCTPSFNSKTIDYKILRIYGMEQPYAPCSFLRKSGLCGEC
jgi:hypothetical protein